MLICDQIIREKLILLTLLQLNKGILRLLSKETILVHFSMRDKFIFLFFNMMLISVILKIF